MKSTHPFGIQSRNSGNPEFSTEHTVGMVGWGPGDLRRADISKSWALPWGPLGPCTQTSWKFRSQRQHGPRVLSSRASIMSPLSSPSEGQPPHNTWFFRASFPHLFGGEKAICFKELVWKWWDTSSAKVLYGLRWTLQGCLLIASCLNVCIWPSVLSAE